MCDLMINLGDLSLRELKCSEVDEDIISTVSPLGERLYGV